MKHKTYSKLGAIAVTLLLASPAAQVAAQARQELTLGEAVERSLQNSKQLKLSTAKIEEAHANYKDMWNNHLPDVKLSGSYIRLNNPTVKLKSSATAQSDTATTSKGASTPDVNSAAYVLVNGTLPIFSGLRIKYGVESMKYLEIAAKLSADNDKEEVVQNTIDAYSNLYKAMKTVELIKENQKQEEQRVTDFTNMESNGVIARNDLLKAELQKSNIDLALLEAENNYKVASVNMDLMLGLPEETLIVPDSSAYQGQNDAGSLVQWEDNALKNRKDLSSLSYNEKAMFSSIRSTKGEYYPGLAVTGGYIAADIPNVLTITNAVNIGLGLQYNFGALWKTGAKVEQAKARLHQVQANQSMLVDQVHLQINQAYQNYLLSNKKIDVYKVAVEQANENYRITHNKYTNSLVTTTDLLDADVAQLQAKLNYSFAKVDAVVAFKKLQQVAGILLDNYQPKNNK